MGITCEPLIDIGSILQPLMMAAVLKGENIPIDAIVDVYIQDAIQNALLQNVTLPQEFAELGNVICLELEMNKIRTLLAVLRGEQPPENTIDKVIDMVLNLQLLSAIGSALSPSTSGSTGTTA